METLSYVALILLSLVGYSGGVVGKAGKSVEIKPQIVDLFLLLLLWTTGITSKLTFALNKWILILLWIVVAILLGMCRAFFGKKAKRSSSATEKDLDYPSGFVRRHWTQWKHFGQRMGSFQSRVLLSFLYFILVSPFALAVKWFSDPLRIKHPSQGTHWRIREEEKPDMELFRRQF
jgi:NADH:ubiquinone oxidoreductase subunit 3 (subunit A)